MARVEEVVLMQILQWMVRKKTSAFTLLELVLVIVLIGIVAASALRPNFNTFRYYQQEGEIRKLAELVTFIYSQAITDGYNYRLEFELSERPQYYQVGQLVPESDFSTQNQFESETLIASEIDYFLYPPPAAFENMLAPENLPSLAKPLFLPDDVVIEDIRTIRGDYISSNQNDRPFILFSPRGFAEFSVIHLRLERSGEAYVTLLINPFTGFVDIYREYKEFEWTYGRK